MGSAGAPLRGCNNAHGEVQWPWECLEADCKTAYQDPTDSQGNGAQLQCPAGAGSSTSYLVEFCPGGVAPLQGLSDAFLPHLNAHAGVFGSFVARAELLYSKLLILFGALAVAWRQCLRKQSQHSEGVPVYPMETDSSDILLAF